MNSDQLAVKNYLKAAEILKRSRKFEKLKDQGRIEAEGQKKKQMEEQTYKLREEKQM